MKTVQASYQLGHTGQTLFTTSFGISLLIHGLVIGWMLSGSGGRSHALLADSAAFQMVSLVDAPGPARLPESAPSVPELQPRAIPEVVSAVAVQNVVPETAVSSPQAKQAMEVPEASVAPPAPALKPVEEPEIPSVVETQVKKPEPAKAPVKKPAPIQTSDRKPPPAVPKATAAQPKAAPKAVAKPRSPAGRNSPQAAAHAEQTIANLRRAWARAQGTSTVQARGGIVASMQDIQLKAYKGRVQAVITQALHLPMMKKAAQALRAVALLTIDREGQVIRYQLLTSSGNQPFDASLQRAVQASSPLPPLPETYSDEILEVELHFTPPASS